MVPSVACELRSPATAFGRAELFSFFSFTPDLRPGLLSAVPPGLEFAGYGVSALSQKGDAMRSLVPLVKTRDFGMTP